MIQFFGINSLNLVLIDRLKGAHLLMNFAMILTEGNSNEVEDWDKYREPLMDIFEATAICLRFQRSVISFAESPRDYITFIIKVIKLN